MLISNQCYAFYSWLSQGKEPEVKIIALSVSGSGFVQQIHYALPFQDQITQAVVTDSVS